MALCVGVMLVQGCHTRTEVSSPSRAASLLKPGDLLFQDLDCGGTCDAIEAVTQGAGGAKLSHVAMVTRVEQRRVWVIEAYANGVEEVFVEALLGRSRDGEGRPKVLVGRLRPEHKKLIPGAVLAARQRLGRPYDEAFSIDDEAHYCSELLYKAFADANEGRPVFSLQPMTFVDPKTGKTAVAWKDYFARLSRPVPEGAPGLNPGGMSRSDVLEIIYAFGAPTGWSPRQ